MDFGFGDFAGLKGGGSANGASSFPLSGEPVLAREPGKGTVTLSGVHWNMPCAPTLHRCLKLSFAASKNGELKNLTLLTLHLTQALPGSKQQNSSKMGRRGSTSLEFGQVRSMGTASTTLVSETAFLASLSSHSSLNNGIHPPLSSG